MKMPDFPVLQRDIAPGAAAQVDVLMDFWQADRSPWIHRNLPPWDMVRLLTLHPPHAANLSYQRDMLSFKDDMGPYSGGTRTCLVWSCLSA